MSISSFGLRIAPLDTFISFLLELRVCQTTAFLLEEHVGSTLVEALWS